MPKISSVFYIICRVNGFVLARHGFPGKCPEKVADLVAVEAKAWAMQLEHLRQCLKKLEEKWAQQKHPEPDLEKTTKSQVALALYPPFHHSFWGVYFKKIPLPLPPPCAQFLK